MAAESPAEEKPEGDGSQSSAPASGASEPSTAADPGDGEAPTESIDSGEAVEAPEEDEDAPDSVPTADARRPAILDALDSTATNTLPSESAVEASDEQTKTETEPAVLKAQRVGSKPAPRPGAGKLPPRPKRPELSLRSQRKSVEVPEAETERHITNKPAASEQPPAAEPAGSRPTALKRPAAMATTEPDATAATVPYIVERDEPIEEPHVDEDGPTLIAYRAKKSDRVDESTLVHPATPGTPLPSASQPPPASMDPKDTHTDNMQLAPHQLFSGLNAGHLAQQLAEREAAVQAALAAATGMAEDAGNRAARYDRVATIGAVGALGVGMFMGALCGYFAAGEAAGGNAGMASAYASLTVLTTIAIFVAGLASLQRSLEMKLAMSAMSALMLLFTFVRLLTVVL